MKQELAAAHNAVRDHSQGVNQWNISWRKKVWKTFWYNGQKGRTIYKYLTSLLIRCDVHSCWYSMRSLLEIHCVPGRLNAKFMMSLKKCSVPPRTSDITSVVKRASATWKPACCQEQGSSVMNEMSCYFLRYKNTTGGVSLRQRLFMFCSTPQHTYSMHKHLLYPTHSS